MDEIVKLALQLTPPVPEGNFQIKTVTKASEIMLKEATYQISD